MMNNFVLLVLIFAGLMLFIFVCAFAYHRQSQRFLEALAADDEPKAKADVGLKVQSDVNAQPSADSKHSQSPANLEVPLQCLTYSSSHSDNFQNLSQLKGIVPYPVPFPASNLKQPQSSLSKNGNHTGKPPSYEEFQA
ncbi:hypothetical protein ACKWTF_014189 [Chironomus riparius]